MRMKSSEKGRNSRKIQFSKESFSHKGCLNALFGWIQISYEFWVPVQYALELSSISRHFYGMGSASKMEITFFIQFILAPRIFLKIGSGLSQREFIQTQRYLPVLSRLVRSKASILVIKIDLRMNR